MSSIGGIGSSSYFDSFKRQNRIINQNGRLKSWNKINVSELRDKKIMRKEVQSACESLNKYVESQDFKLNDGTFQSNLQKLNDIFKRSKFSTVTDVNKLPKEIKTTLNTISQQFKKLFDDKNSDEQKIFVIQVISKSDLLKYYGLFNEVNSSVSPIDSSTNSQNHIIAERDSIVNVSVKSEPYNMKTEIKVITDALAKIKPNVNTISAGYYAKSGPKLNQMLSSLKHSDENKLKFEIKGFEAFLNNVYQFNSDPKKNDQIKKDLVNALEVVIMNYLPQADDAQSVSSDSSNKSDTKNTPNEITFINYEANTNNPITDIIFDINSNKNISPYKSLINIFGDFVYADTDKSKIKIALHNLIDLHNGLVWSMSKINS